MEAEALVQAMELVFRELALFAAFGFLIGSIDNLLIDIIWIWRCVIARMGMAEPLCKSLADIPASAAPGRHAIFIPAWDEAGVIGPMLANLAARFEGQNYHAFVGCYPNDPGTAREISEIGLRCPNIQLVQCPNPGPTTKADCLNSLWHAMLAMEADTGIPFKSVILHDAEDVVHPLEIELFDRLIDANDLVQIPVVPLPDPDSVWIAGHYCDEFAEAHTKDMCVRDWLSASIPSAGVGCAISRPILGGLADQRHGDPFDPNSLTEDYELGLVLAQQRRTGLFIRCTGNLRTDLVAVRAHFPASLGSALRQKTRWVEGISLFGWDRLGWDAGFIEFWMRFRDRRTILAAIIIASGYCTALLGLALAAISAMSGISLNPLPPVLLAMLSINFVLLLWRLGIRASITARHYGWRSGLIAIPRTIISNILSIMVARRALGHYIRARSGTRPIWEKTRHVFPDTPQR